MRTKLHAQLPFSSDGSHKFCLVIAGQVHALHLEILAQQLPRSQRSRREGLAAIAAAARVALQCCSIANLAGTDRPGAAAVHTAPAGRAAVHG